MRILHILNDVTDRGNGIVNTAVDLALEQARLGNDVAVASAGGGYEALLQEHGVQHLLLDQSRRPARLFGAIRTLLHYIRALHPDVIHVHNRTGLLLAWIGARFEKYTLVAQVHNVHDRESLMMGIADRVIAVSQSVADSMVRQGISKKKIRTVLNRTLGTPRLPPLSGVVPAELAHPAIVTVCGMNHRKGIAELIAAFEVVAEKFPLAHLYLVGDGPQRALFEQQACASQYGERIHFEGFRSEPRAYMLAADIFVLASRRESFGLVLIEAREAGCAIIASRVDGITEALSTEPGGEEAGLLAQPGNPRSLAEALNTLLASESEREHWQKKARTGIDGFHVRLMAAEVQQVYDDLLGVETWRGATQEALPQERAGA